MENYKLSQTEIDALYLFCIKHGVKYYDVQVELVDHLASAIEVEITNNSNLSFEDCLQREYKSFGNVGFSKLISERRSAVEKGIRKKRISILKKSITPPLLFITIAILFLPIYLISNKDFINMKKLNYIYLFIDVIVMLYWVVQITIFQRQRNKTRSKMLRLKIMMEDIPKIWQACFLIMTIFNNLQGLVQFISYSRGNGSFALISSYLILNTIFSFILILFIQENRLLHQFAKEEYPEAFIA